MNIKGVIVRITPFKEKDAMMNLLTEKGNISFLARSILNGNSQNNILSTPLLYGDFTFSDNRSHSFKEVTPLLDIRNYMSDLSTLIVINFLQEVTLKLFNDEDMYKIYPYLVESLNLLENKKQLLSIILMYLATSLRLAGFGLEVDHCVITNSNKDIVAISLNDGGFISRNAYKPHEHIVYDKEKCSILRFIFKLEAAKMKEAIFPQEAIKSILNDLFLYLYNQTGTKLKSEKMIKNI